MIRLSDLDPEMKTFVMNVAQCAANRTLEGAGLDKVNINLTQAYTMYGRRDVDRWRKEGLIQVKKDGPGASKTRILRAQIEAVAAASNRTTYLKTKDR